MLLKLMTILLIAALPAAHAAMPQKEFCKVAAGNAYAASEARTRLSMTAAEFQARAANYYLANVLPALQTETISKSQAEALMKALETGWEAEDPDAIAAEVYKKCLPKQEV
jgi:uncharacterized paraquat-inducible protein A